MMLRKKFGAVAALWLAVAASAWAQDPPPASDVGGETPPADAAPPAIDAIGQFDADADGQLLGDELRRARDFMQALRGALGDRRRDAGPPRDGDRPPRERRGRGDRGERGRRGGPPPADEAPAFEIGDGQPPRPDGPPPGEGGEIRPERRRPAPAMRLFRTYDDNQDGQLNRDEFAALMGALRERREHGPPGPPEARGDEPADLPRGPRRMREGGRRPLRDGAAGPTFAPDSEPDGP